jgi:heme/copper-type cytochrome/quinol oxidase subunit 3
VNATTAPIEAPLPLSGIGSRPSGWWGMILLIATEATLFLLLIASYLYLRNETKGPWPPAPFPDPGIVKPLGVTLLVVVSILPLGWARRRMLVGASGRARLGIALALVLGVAFLVLQWLLVRESLRTVTPRDNAYGSIYYTIIGVHFVHVAAGVLGLGWALLRTPRFTPERHLTLRVISLYWTFVVVISAVVFLTLYLVPRG